MKYKGIIYTVVFGDYDEIRPPLFKNEDWYYLLITDKSENADKPEAQAFDNVYSLFGKSVDVFTQRYEKIMMDIVITDLRQAEDEFVDLPRIIYHDGKLQQSADINPLADLLTEDIDLVVKEHPDRSCIYDEAEVVSRGRLARPDLVQEQMTKYEKEWRVPRKVGLVDSCILVRWANQTEYQEEFYEKWWNEVDAHTHRDQLSFNAVLWQHPLRVKYYTDYFQWFKKHPHAKPREIKS